MSNSKKVMRDSIRMFFPTGRSLAMLLTHVSRGMAADALLSQDALDVDGSIVMLPQFSIREYEGSESLNRIQWEGDDGRCVRIVGYTETVTLNWRIQDSSLPELTGQVTLTPFAGAHAISGDLPPLLGLEGTIDPAARPVAGEPDVRRLLSKLSRAGREHLFSLANLFTPYARDAVNGASIRVHREIHEHDTNAAAAHIIDEIERESVLDELMLGARQNESVIIRLIRRVAVTDVTVCKSVALYMATAIWSGAETAVRHHIGDPHLGRVIRRLARELRRLDPHTDIDAGTVLEAFKREHPTQRIGMTRILDALTAGATVSSQIVQFDLDPDAVVAGDRA